MSNEILVAVIVSFSSLVVAVVSLIQSFLSNRQSKEAEERLEKLKYELAEKTLSRSLKDKNLTENIEALNVLITEIQKVKDILQILIDAEDKYLNLKETGIDIKTAREKIFLCYEEKLPYLTESEAGDTHRAKKCIFSTELLMNEFLNEASTNSDIKNSLEESLKETRVELTDIQNSLRDSKTNKLLERFNSL